MCGRYPRVQIVTDDQLRAAADAGLTQAEAARYFGVSKVAVSRRKQRLGLTFLRARQGRGGSLFARLSDEEMVEYRVLTSRHCCTRAEALRGIGRGDLT